jgi:NADH-quinone oxidoreductase subunit M
MVNHGISTAALFLIAGFLVSRKGTRFIADYGGVQQVAPVLAGTFLVAGLATLSLPGLAPFISEFLIDIRIPLPGWPSWPPRRWCSRDLRVWMYQRMMTGPAPLRRRRSARPGTARADRGGAPLIALLLVLGVYPKPALNVINPAVTHTLDTIGQADPAPRVAEGPPR